MKLDVWVLSSMSLSTAALAGSCWRDTPCNGLEKPSFPGPWDKNNYSPASRNVSPERVLDKNHDLISKWPHEAELKGNGSMVIFDFGKEVGGILSVEYKACGSGTLGLAFSESRNYTGYISDESNGGTGPDGAIHEKVSATDCTSTQKYVTPDELQRGGFRYLTLYVLEGDSAEDKSLEIGITDIDLEITFQPTWQDLRAYGGYFHSNDEMLNRIWYASAYTIQTNTIPSDSARVYPCLNTGWLNNASLGTTGASAIVDGTKRDRAIWAGDLGVATRSALVGLGDEDSVKNALDVQFINQADSGELPMVGPPINFFSSDSYHMSTLIGMYDYLLYSGDGEYLDANWEGFKRAMKFVTDKIDDTGLMNVNGPNNWGRDAAADGHTTDGNMLLYRSLITGAEVAEWKHDKELCSEWRKMAESVKKAVNKSNWDDSTGAFKNKDNDDSVYPEDGNSLALYYEGVASKKNVARVSEFLKSQWGPIGAITQELAGNVVPYIESFEIKGHLVARQAKAAIDLMRLSWGWYLDSPYGTQSTMLEGYHTDGSFRYRNIEYNKNGSYTSHAHGWSTGPTDALTSYVVGLRPTGMGGSTWILEPQFGDLKFAEAGYTGATGKFSAKWELQDWGYKAKYSVPKKTKGQLVLPTAADGSRPKKILVDCKKVKFDFSHKDQVARLSAKGGEHQISVVY